MLSERIKAETKQAHQALEKQLIPYIKNISSKEEYLKLLEVFYSYMKPIEDELDKYLNDNIIPQYNRRRNADAIVADMQIIGNGAHTLPETSRYTPTIETEPQALGAMYVLEGSTLGGKIITKMLQDRLNISGTEGVTFFSGYGDETEAMWKSFVQAMNSYTQDDLVKDNIIATANETFTHFRNLIVEKLDTTYAD